MSFYSPTIYIFFIVLFFCLIMYIYMIKNNNIYNDIHMYKMNVCPDFWDNDVSGNCYFPTLPSFVNKNHIINSGNLLSLQNNNQKPPYSHNGISFSINNALWSSVGQSTICAQREWAIKNHIVWDGVSNYNQCI